MKERPRKKPKKKTPRPRHEFCETRLGWIMKIEAPVLYSVITKITSSPSRDMLRSMAAYSDDPFLQSDEFWLELVKYRPGKWYTPSAQEEAERLKGKEFSGKAIDTILSHLHNK